MWQNNTKFRKALYPQSLQPVCHLVRRYAEALLKKGMPAPSVEMLKEAFPKYNRASFAPAKESIDAKDDLLLLLASLFVKQDFASVVDIMEESEFICDRGDNFELFFGIALNRVRDHARAEIYLRNVFEGGRSVDSQAIAACYYIVNLIYLNKTNEALVVRKDAQRLSSSKYYPYILRNSASLESGESLVEYLENLNETQVCDLFCQGTIENNLGRAYLSTGRYRDAENMFSKANTHLAGYWQRNNAIVFNNRAILECMKGDYGKALSFVDTATALARGELPSNEMQQIFIDITKAAVLFHLGDPSYNDHIESVEQRVLAHPVRHTKEVYYANRALFEVISKGPKAAEYIMELSQFRNVLHPDKTDEIVKTLSQALAASEFDADLLWEKCFDPPYLVFWYVNPVSIAEDDISRAMRFVARSC